MNTFFAALLDAIDPAVVATNAALWLPRLGGAVAALAFFVLAHRFVQRAVRFALDRTEVDSTARAFASALVKYALGTVEGKEQIVAKAI